MSAEIRQHAKTCATCATYASKQAKETPIISAIPDRPWKKVATDMLSWAGDEYLMDIFKLDKLRHNVGGSHTKIEGTLLASWLPGFAL